MIEQVVFKSEDRVVAICGLVGDRIFEEIKENECFYEDSFLFHLRDKYKKFLKDKTAIDIGANIGNHSIFFSKFLECKTILCFEPVSQIYNILNANAIKGMEGYNYAIGSSGNLTFGMKDDKNLGTYRKNGGHKHIVVKCEKLDFFECWKYDSPVEFIKIDVEGMEYEVLQSAIKTIEMAKPTLIVLESWDLVETMNTCGRFLYDFGYTLQPIFNIEQGFKDKCYNLEFTYNGKYNEQKKNS